MLRNAKKKKGKLVGNGLPRLLTGDDFFDHVVDLRTPQLKKKSHERTAGRRGMSMLR